MHLRQVFTCLRGHGLVIKTVKCVLKVHKHEIFFLTVFAETEIIWSQGPVTRDF
jgi:hypothetical protein